MGRGGDMSSTVIAALDRIADNIGVGFGGWPIPAGAISDPREQVLIRYTVGTGEFSADMKYNVLRMKMFKMNGEPDGTHDGVWEPQLPPAQLKKRPKPPQGPLDKPEGPIEHVPIRAYTKAIWRFGDGSSITAVGPAMLHLVEFNDQSNIFLVSVAAIITNGTGQFDGAYGVKTALGSTFVPKGVDMFNMKPGQTFGARTIETFRVVTAEHLT
jgi:hypothetical protein